MQNIIEKGPQKYKDKVFSLVMENFVDLSLNKYASHVTEKAILYSNDDYRSRLLDNLEKIDKTNKL